MYQRLGAARSEQATRLPRLWPALHARESARRAHGFLGRRLRSVLSISTACRREGVKRPMSDDNTTLEQFACPVPTPAQEKVLLGHGSGGRLSAELLQKVFLPAFHNPARRA